MKHWFEDELYPRIDFLSRDFLITDQTLPVEHPEWFRRGDIVRVGEDDLYDTGEVDDWGNPIFRALNEAVKVTSVPDMFLERAISANPAQPKPKGERVIIIGTGH